MPLDDNAGAEGVEPLSNVQPEKLLSVRSSELNHRLVPSARAKGKPELEFRDEKLLRDYLFMVQNFPMVVESLRKMETMLENQKKLNEQVASLNELLNQKPKPFNRELQRLYES